MKNTLIYYLVILIPVPIMIWLVLTDKTLWFVISLLFYALVFRPITDSYRLIKKEAIRKKDIWKLFVPFYGRTIYFKKLYYYK
jgi:hypothetical protein